MPGPTPEPESHREHRHRQYRQPYRGRVRSGCLTCRARKVKCDEQRPNCNNCKRTARDCVYKPRKVHTTSNSATAPPRKVARNESIAENEVGHTPDTDCTSLTITVSPLESHDGLGEWQAPLADIESRGGDLAQELFSSLYDSIMGVRLRLQNALRRQCEVSDVGNNAQVGPNAASALISRDIELTTTMDILSSREIPLQQSFSYFIDAVECPSITPFDSINWQRMKAHVVDLGLSDPAVASAVIAVSALYKGQTYGLPLANALTLYNAAKGRVEKTLEDETQDFDTILVATFLLCLYDFISYENVPFLKQPPELYIQRLGAWSQCTSPHPLLSVRIVAWLRILNVITRRGGGKGIISTRVVDLLPHFSNGTPNIKPLSNTISDPSNDLFELLSAPIFEFYFSLQMISGNIAELTHYRRSRTTSDDQEEVVQLIATLKAELRSLWTNRSPIQHQAPAELRSHLAPKISRPIIALSGICAAAYYSEFVEIDRVMGDPVTRALEAAQARSHIRDIVDMEWVISGSEKLNSGYVRPLFLCAIECTSREENHWAVERLREIKNPICYSDFFAAFGEALADMQLKKDRRVTSKYFCIKHFGVPPPFI